MTREETTALFARRQDAMNRHDVAGLTALFAADCIVESPTAGGVVVFSPDGRWVAYASQEGRSLSAVYVQPFPPMGALYQISKNTDDGHHPMWSPDGAELLFSGGFGAGLTAVRITTQPSFRVGEPMPVPRQFQGAGPGVERPFDISRDGQHFLGLIDAAQTQ